MKPALTPPRRPGFSLVEMLAALGVGSIILVAGATILGSAGSGYERGSGGIAAEREGRAVLTQLTDDLAKAVWHSSTTFRSPEGAWPQHEIGFFALQPEDAQAEDKRIGDLCSAHYYLKDLQIGKATVRCLMRGFRNSSDTFDAIRTGSTDSIFSPDALDEPVAFGVIAFEATPISRNDSGEWEKWTESTTSDSSPAFDPATYNPTANRTPQGPEALRLRLVVARKELIGKLATGSDWSSHPLLGDPSRPNENRYLEVYEATARYGSPR